MELATLFVAIIGATVASMSLAVSIVTAIHQARLKRSQLDLDREHKALEARVLELQERELRASEDRSRRADLSVRLEEHGLGHRIVIRNDGAADALDVNLEVSGRDADRSPLVEEDVQAKLPIPRLVPGQECPLLAGVGVGCWPPFDAVLTWRDPNGEPRRRERTIYDG